MFSLARGLYTSLFADDTKKVLIVGLESSGKTTLAEQLKYMYGGGAGRNGDDNSIDEDGGSSAATTGAKCGSPAPAPAEVLKRKNIRATTGLNRSRVTHVTSPPRHSAGHESFTPSTTPLVLWDIGGSLRPLWGNFFSICHAVIFVVDSTIGEGVAVSVGRGEENSQAPYSGGAESEGVESTQLSSPTSTVHEMGEKSLFLRTLYAKAALVLRQVFCHPLLAGAPLLIVSNKVDATNHHTLVEMQDALRLTEMALIDESYTEDCVVGNPVYGEGIPGEYLVDESFRRGNAFGERSTPPPGSSGIGNKVMRLVEMSALDGKGIAEGMDWLVARIHDSDRRPRSEDGR